MNRMLDNLGSRLRLEQILFWAGSDVARRLPVLAPLPESLVSCALRRLCWRPDLAGTCQTGRHTDDHHLGERFFSLEHDRNQAIY